MKIGKYNINNTALIGAIVVAVLVILGAVFWPGLLALALVIVIPTALTIYLLWIYGKNGSP